MECPSSLVLRGAFLFAIVELANECLMRGPYHPKIKVLLTRMLCMCKSFMDSHQNGELR